MDGDHIPMCGKAGLMDRFTAHPRNTTCPECQAGLTDDRELPQAARKMWA